MLNQFMNPLFLLRLAQSYLQDVKRLEHSTSEQIRRYQNACLRKIVKQAYMVPAYRDKYQKEGIRIKDIQTIDDIVRLPIISKDDLRKYYPSGITAKSYNPNNGFLIHTSGSTGEPVFVYTDLFSAIKSLEGFVRTLHVYGGDWRTSRIAMVIDTSPGSVEHMIFTSSAIPFLHRFVKLSNIRYLDIATNPEEVMMELEQFNPEFIGSDPNMLRKLSFLRYHDKGVSVNPQYIFSSGAMLDSYTRDYVHHAFDVPVYDVYGTTEAGPLAFQCPHNRFYHVHSDFVYLESVDEVFQPVGTDSAGNLVVTKLYGTATPIIRYSGINDVVKLDHCTSDCDVPSQVIREIEGRTTDLLTLPDGSLLSPLTVTGIPAKIMQEYNSYKIKQFQIIQKAYDEIDVLVVIDNELRNTGVAVTTLMDELKKRFESIIGQHVRIVVHEVEQIQNNQPADTIKVVISKVTKKPQHP